MRTGGAAVQQALTAEAAIVVNQAVALARQRGHAQVTPLHVANSMLAHSTGLFRQACLKSHSHTLQCRALELCFNVALNRLPAASSNPMLIGPHRSQHPAISNALVAAFKRAQAHQRRGTIENNSNQQQQQPVLAVKIELDQLIISILDDPSVSRVMKEAGFSSTKVKTNVEQAISLQISSQTSPESNHQTVNNDQDLIGLIESLMMKRRSRKSIVMVGECIESLESKVKSAMETIDKGGVAEAMREVKFISFPLFSFVSLRREEVEKKIEELACLVRGLLGKGVVLYLGDLKWVVDYRANNNGGQKIGHYCPVEHMVMEVGRLIHGFGESEKFGVMGIATFQTYMRSRDRHNSLERVWGLHPVTVPVGGLGLSLIPHSDDQANSRNEKDETEESHLLFDKGDHEKQLRCCADCSAKFEAEARNLQIMVRCNSESALSSLPSWLKDESKKSNSNHQSCATILKELREKWNSICNAFHKQSKSLETALTFPSPSSSSSPSSSNSCFSYDQQFHDLQLQFDHPKQSWRDDHHSFITASHNIPCETTLRMHIQADHTDCTQAFSINNSTSSSETMEMDYAQKFKELNAANLNILCDALEKKVPWQKGIIPEIAGTILQCRSGMLRRKDRLINGGQVKQETWLIFHGQDSQAKEEIARELARVVFGSYSNLVSISLSSSNFFSTRSDYSCDQDLIGNKRCRDEQSCNYMDRFGDAVCVNRHRVFFVEDVKQADYCSRKGIKMAIETGKINNSWGEEVSFGDAIIIFSCEDFDSRSRACSPSSVKQQKIDGFHQEEKACTVSLDLNLYFDGESVEDHLSDDTGVLENDVDKRVVFRIVGD